MTSYVIGRLRPIHAHMRALGAIVAIVAAALTALLNSNWMSESPAGRAPSGSPPAAAPAGAASAAPGALSPQLARLASTDPARWVEVIIQLNRGAGFAQGSRLVQRLGGKPGLDLHIV